jgi:hypothetical protein
MTISKRSRDQDEASAFHALVDQFLRCRVYDASFSPDVEPFSKCRNTTWQSISLGGWLNRTEISGRPHYALTPSGFAEALRRVVIPRDQGLKEELGRLQGAMKRYVKGRNADAVVDFEDLQRDSGLPEEFVFNAIECSLAEEILNEHGGSWERRGVRIRIPTLLGIELAQHEKSPDVRYREAKEELREYRCSFCDALNIEMGSSPASDGDRSYFDSYDCGRIDVDGQIDRPCPSAKFPQLDDYELDAFENRGEGLVGMLIGKMPSMRWKCEARPTTADAAQFPVALGYGSSRKEAIEHVCANYEKVRQKYKLRRQVIA